MSLTAPQFHKTAIVTTNTRDGGRRVVWFINGTHPTADPQNATPWPCLECYDGTTRVAPSGGSMANLPVGNLWRPVDPEPATPPQNSWAVFESLGGVVANKFNLFVKCQLFGEFSFALAPLGDWTVGGGTPTSPTLPATILGEPPNTPGSIDIAWANTVDRFFSVLLDEGMILLRAARASTHTDLKWAYIGEINPHNGVAQDPRPFVVPINMNTPSLQAGAHWRRISPIDDSTLVTCNHEVRFDAALDSATEYNDLGREYISSVDLFANTAGHRFHIGSLRNVAAGPSTIPANRATVGTSASDFRFEAWGSTVSGDDPYLVVPYPPGTALAQGHSIIDEETIPPEVEVPTTPPVVDTTKPVVTYVDPTPGSTIVASRVITVDITDNSGSFSNISLWVRFDLAKPNLPDELIFNGAEFTKFYRESTIASITDGFRFVLERRDPDPASSNRGWPSQPFFEADAIDQSGNRA